MDLKRGPFSLYDFLGYFVPGASIIYLLGPASSMAGLRGIATSLGSLTKVSDLLPFVLCSYILGQLTALCSSFIVERFAIWRFGYPSKYLLNESVERYWISAGALPGAIVGSLLLPIVAMDFIVGRWLGFSRFYCQALDAMLVDIIKIRVNCVLQTLAGKATLNGSPYPAKNSDFFRCAYHFAVENAPAHFPKMQNYVALFGFYRAFSLVAVGGFWYTTSAAVVQGTNLTLWLSSILFLITSYLFFIGFLKFYRRFSLEALMAATVVAGSSAQ